MFNRVSRSNDPLSIKILRIVAAAGFIAAGIAHFVRPGVYRRIVPPGFPAPDVLVAISGIAEITGGVGLLIPPLRRWAGLGLILLLIAVFPANVYMALVPDREPARSLPAWMLWARLPVQAVFIAWVWVVSFRRPRAGTRTHDDRY